ncbi:hypothetical protein MKW92_001305 [Papaver armeniacum]|nr:hypothetical protein MKW92_001305 [Papaver armeniacum]
MALVATFMLSLVARSVVPFDYGMVLSDPNIWLLYLFSISSLSVISDVKRLEIISASFVAPVPRKTFFISGNFRQVFLHLESGPTRFFFYG